MLNLANEWIMARHVRRQAWPRRSVIVWGACALAAYLVVAYRPAVAVAAIPAAGVAREAGGMLPAYRSAHRFFALDSDASRDARWADPELYAITAPPPAGIRAMAEWEPMRAIVMAYPHGTIGHANASATLVQIGLDAASVAQVWYIVDDNAAKRFLVQALLAAGMSRATLDSKVKFLYHPLDSVWLIDFGPLPLIDPKTGTFAFADLRYYPRRPDDDGVPTWLGRQLPALGLPNAVPTYRMPLSAEGGNFQSTTDGVCFTSSRELYDMSCDVGGCDDAIRHTSLTQLQNTKLAVRLRGIWRRYAGCKAVLIVQPITDDRTGHIDMFLKILDDDRILLGQYLAPYGDPAEETNAARLDEDAKFIAAYVKPDGGHFTVARIVMPGHRSSPSSGTVEPVPFTYVNATFINGLNLWPTYSFPEWKGKQAQAEATWRRVLPGYRQVGINADELSFWSGAIHCVTRTIPAVAPGVWIGDGTCRAGKCQAPPGGYSGLCRPGGATADVCYGPAWECTCNDCSSGCTYKPGQTGGSCGLVRYIGCCAGATVQYCDAGQIQASRCQGGCGWDAAHGYYGCGFSGADPSGAIPRACPAIGCTSACGGKVCGDDGCGGSCGTCPDRYVCKGNRCVATACTDACTAGARGCTSVTVAWTCAEDAEGCLERARADCGAQGLVCASGRCVVARGADAAGGGFSATADAGPGVGADVAPGPADGGPWPHHRRGCTGASGTRAAWWLAALLLLGVRRRRPRDPRVRAP